MLASAHFFGLCGNCYFRLKAHGALAKARLVNAESFFSLLDFCGDSVIILGIFTCSDNICDSFSVRLIIHYVSALLRYSGSKKRQKGKGAE